MTGRRELTVTVAFRVPLPTYREVVARAESEGVVLSRVLRRALSHGLAAEAHTHQAPRQTSETQAVSDGS